MYSNQSSSALVIGSVYASFLTALFFIMKLGHAIAWSWIWVFAPVWIFAAALVLIGILAMVLYALVGE